MKRFLALVLVTALALFVLAACGDSGSNDMPQDNANMPTENQRYDDPQVGSLPQNNSTGNNPSAEEMLVGIWRIYDSQIADDWPSLGVRMFFSDGLFAAADNTWYVIEDMLFPFGYRFHIEEEILTFIFEHQIPGGGLQITEYEFRRIASPVDYLPNNSLLTGRWDAIGSYPPMSIGRMIILLPDGTASFDNNDIVTWEVKDDKLYLTGSEPYIFHIYEDKLFLDDGIGILQRVRYDTVLEQNPSLAESPVLNLGFSSGETLSAGAFHTVGLKPDGTVVTVGYGADGLLDTSGWSDIVSVSAGLGFTIGLRSNGTVIAVGGNIADLINADGWRDIVAVSAGHHHAVGLRADGTVVVAGNIILMETIMSDWSDIIAVSAGLHHTVGLGSDGTVVAVGNGVDGWLDVSDWSDIIAIYAGFARTVGLRSNGTVVGAGSNAFGSLGIDDWNGIVAVSTGDDHTVGLRSDGTAIAVGCNEFGQSNVINWMLRTR